MIQISCNARNVVTSVNASWPGNTHDERVFENSQLCIMFERGHQGLLIGDKGYMLTPYFMIPYTEEEGMTRTEMR